MNDSRLTAGELAKIDFPKCSQRCLAVEKLGVCECESICPFKFDKKGNPIRR